MRGFPSWLEGAVCLVLSHLCCVTLAVANDEPRRAEIAEKARGLLKNTTNHCAAFRDIVAFAADRHANTGPFIEDLKLVLVGETLRHRGTGKHYVGNTTGARGDSGFKDELRDGSPQVEHAFAAIYIGKTMLPGSSEAVALWTEIVGPATEGNKPNNADVLLYALGSDIGQRLADKNLKQIPGVIQRTMCK